MFDAESEQYYRQHNTQMTNTLQIRKFSQHNHKTTSEVTTRGSDWANPGAPKLERVPALQCTERLV